MASKPEQTLQERWAATPGMPDAINQLDSYEQALIDREVEPDSADVDEKKRRLGVVTYLRAGLAVLDPVLASPAFVSNFQGQVAGARSAFDNFAFQRGQGEDGLSEFTRVLSPGASAPEAVTAITAAQAEIREVALELETSLEAAKEVLESLTTKRGAFEADIEERMRHADERFEGEVSSFSERSQFDVVNKLKEFEIDRVTAVKAYEDSQQTAETILGEMREKLSIATDTALSHDYGKAAIVESETADKMRLGAIIFGIITGVIALAGVVLQVILGVKDSGVSAIALVPGKLAAVAAFAAVAGWLGRESNRHRAEAMKLRRTELQLRNLGSFLAELEPADRNAARKQLLPRFFSDDLTQPILDGPDHLATLRDIATGDAGS